MTETLVSSLVSGLVGVIVGTIFQSFHNMYLNKYQIRQDQKRQSITEWKNLLSDIRFIFSNPNERNHIYFRQIFLLKILTLENIGNTFCSQRKVKSLIEKLKDTDEQLSLSGIAEEALCMSADSDAKIKLENQIYLIIIDTVKQVQSI